MSDNDEYRISTAVGELIGSPLTVDGEEGGAFKQLHAEIEKVVRPTDVFDTMLVSDIAHHFWQQLRLRKCSNSLERFPESLNWEGFSF